MLAGAVPPHHHIGGESCLGAIDQDPVDTFGARVDHECPGWADGNNVVTPTRVELS